MGRARNLAVVAFLSAAALIAASAVFAASPQEIYNDYADNGRLDGQYSTSDLERALSNAVVQAYGKDQGTGLKPEIEEEINESSGATSGGSTGGGAAGVSGSEGAPPAVTTGGGLPFTGLDLGLIAAGAAGLLLLGVALRRVARQRQ